MLKKLLTHTRLHPLYRRLQREPYYRFRSVDEIQLAASWGIAIDVNTASVDEWLRLPGLSIHQARLLNMLTTNQTFLYCIEDIAAALNVPAQQISQWQPILKFCYYDPDSDLKPVPINVNTATLDELTNIPVLDPFLAKSIVYARRVKPYQNLADLQQRLRLGSHITAELLHYLSFHE